MEAEKTPPRHEEEEEDEGVMASWLITVDEETSTELSKLLESSPPPVKVRFIDDPYASGVVFQSSSAYVTINGNEESCGSSFSDSDSSVMASVHVDGGAKRRNRSAWGWEETEARGWFGDGFLMDGCDDDDGDGDGDGDGRWMEFLGEEEVW